MPNDPLYQQPGKIPEDEIDLNRSTTLNSAFLLKRARLEETIHKALDEMEGAELLPLLNRPKDRHIAAAYVEAIGQRFDSDLENLESPTMQRVKKDIEALLTQGVWMPGDVSADELAEVAEKLMTLQAFYEGMFTEEEEIAGGAEIEAEGEQFLNELASGEGEALREFAVEFGDTVGLYGPREAEHLTLLFHIDQMLYGFDVLGALKSLEQSWYKADPRKIEVFQGIINILEKNEALSSLQDKSKSGAVLFAAKAQMIREIFPQKEDYRKFVIDELALRIPHLKEFRQVAEKGGVIAKKVSEIFFGEAAEKIITLTSALALEKLESDIARIYSRRP